MGEGLPRLVDGHLPVGRHHLTETDVVAAFGEGTARRSHLASQWMLFRRSLAKVLSPSVQWVGGSFISDTPLPNDVDVVSIYDSALWSRLEPAERRGVTALLDRHAAIERFECDSYQVVRYPPTAGPQHIRSSAALDYWDDLFSFTRPRADGSREERGYVEVPG